MQGLGLLASLGECAGGRALSLHYVWFHGSRLSTVGIVAWDCREIGKSREEWENMEVT